MKPPKLYRHPEGYRYFQTSVTVDGKRVRPTVHEHQLVFLLHDQADCDDPECDCACPPECPTDHEYACPYKIFSGGVWQLHHGPLHTEDPDLDDDPMVPDKWANWTSNLRLMPDDAHAQQTYRSTLAERVGESPAEMASD